MGVVKRQSRLLKKQHSMIGRTQSLKWGLTSCYKSTAFSTEWFPVVQLANLSPVQQGLENPVCSVVISVTAHGMFRKLSPFHIVGMMMIMMFYMLKEAGIRLL